MALANSNPDRLCKEVGIVAASAITASSPPQLRYLFCLQASLTHTDIIPKAPQSLRELNGLLVISFLQLLPLPIDRLDLPQPRRLPPLYHKSPSQPT